jgi:hypothetical protein
MGRAASRPAAALCFASILVAFTRVLCPAQSDASTTQTYFVDCSSTASGVGSLNHPWNSLKSAEEHPFSAGDRIALRRGTACHGTFAPKGSGTKDAPTRLTAYGEGPRPRIVAAANDRQVLLLSNQEYWQIDSLDLSGANTYGIFVTGDKGILHHLYLKNLSVHDVVGGEMKHKDSGLVVIGPSKLGAFFDDVLVDGVDAAHTNQWAGILVGGGPFYIPPDKFINKNVIIRNSTVHDVYGDGIVLFRDADSLIEKSVAWETGMQPTQTIGTPNAIWTWTCTDCTVADNEAFLTDSPGVDGGAYDIDWSNTRNTVERNFAHDTQGYCFAVFAAGYVTSTSVVRDNLCADNGLSPRLAAMQGAAYLSTWNGGVIRDLRIENNTFIFNPPIASAAAIVDIAETGGTPILFAGNHIESSAPLMYKADSQFASSSNTYEDSGSNSEMTQPLFTLGAMNRVPLDEVQASGLEHGSTVGDATAKPAFSGTLRVDATLSLALDPDGLLASETRSQLVVLRSLANQYAAGRLKVTVHLRKTAESPQEHMARTNAMQDFNADRIQFENDGHGENTVQLLAANGRVLEQWRGLQNAATLGGAVRKLLGVPQYSQIKDDLSARGAR